MEHVPGVKAEPGRIRERTKITHLDGVAVAGAGASHLCAPVVHIACLLYSSVCSGGPAGSRRAVGSVFILISCAPGVHVISLDLVRQVGQGRVFQELFYPAVLGDKVRPCPHAAGQGGHSDTCNDLCPGLHFFLLPFRLFLLSFLYLDLFLFFHFCHSP